MLMHSPSQLRRLQQSLPLAAIAPAAAGYVARSPVFGRCATADRTTGSAAAPPSLPITQEFQIIGLALE
jgi:hypothetical protein